MNYQTLITNAMGWLADDPTRIAWIIGTIVVIGAASGIYRSLGHCKNIGHCGRRIL
jgi:hypothetical protein